MEDRFQPFIGPRPFGREDRAVFFGRDREGRELVSLIVAHRAVLLYSQSGAGKSSLINALVLPSLEKRGFEVLPPATFRGLIPGGVAAEEIPNLYVFRAVTAWEDDGVPQELMQASLRTYLEERRRTVDKTGAPARRLMVFDQMEELFTIYPENWGEKREDFFRQATEALEADPGLRILFVIREDYLAQLDPYTGLLPEDLQIRFRLEPLARDQALPAVEGPIRGTGRSFAKGVAASLVEQLLTVKIESVTGKVEEAVGEYVEPVQLQVVCRNLWLSLPDDAGVITRDHIRAFGDVDEALMSFYGSAVRAAAEKFSMGEGVIREWFERELMTPSGTRGTVFRGGECTGGIPNEVVEMLESSHVVRAERRRGLRWYELTHDRLLEPVRRSNREWLSARPEEDRIRRRLEGRAADWERSGKSAACLLGEEELPEAEYWLEGPGVAASEYGDKIYAFVKASRAAEEERRARRQARSARRFRRLSYSLTVAIVLAGSALFYAAKKHGEASRHAEEADSSAVEAHEAGAMLEYKLHILKADSMKIERQKGYAMYFAETARHGLEEARLNELIISAHNSVLKEDYDAAIDQLKRAVARDSSRSWPFRLLAYANVMKEKYDSAIAAYLMEVEIDPSAWSYARLGEACRKSNDCGYSEAVKYLMNALYYDPDYAWAIRELGLVYMQKGNDLRAKGESYGAEAEEEYRRAAYEFERAIRIDSTAWTFARLGEVYGELGDTASAIRNFVELTKKEPQNRWAYDEIALLYHGKEKYDSVVSSLENAIGKIVPLNWYDLLGKSYFDGTCEYEEAYRCFERARKIDPGNRNHTANFAEASLATERFEEACDLAGEVLGNPDLEPPLSLSIRLSMRFIRISSLIMRGMRDEAESELEEFIRFYKDHLHEYEPAWTYKGSRRFFEDEERDVGEGGRRAILTLIDYLERPSPDISMERFEAALR